MWSSLGGPLSKDKFVSTANLYKTFVHIQSYYNSIVFPSWVIVDQDGGEFLNMHSYQE